MLRAFLKASFLVFLAGLPTVSFADTFIVTSVENKQSLDLDQVISIFKGDVQKWESGKSIVLAVPDLASPEGEKMLEKIYGNSAKEYKKFWMQKVFKGEASNPPENKNGDSMKQFLKAYPDAIGILPGSLIDASVRKVIKID